MAEKTEKAQARAGRPNFKVAVSPISPEEIFVDGVAGVMARPGLMKLDLYRVVRVDPKDNAEVRTVTHRLVLPSSAVPDLVRAFQSVAEAGRRRRTTEPSSGSA